MNRWWHDPSQVADDRLPAHGLGPRPSAIDLDGEWMVRAWRGDTPLDDWASGDTPDGFHPVTVPGTYLLADLPDAGVPHYTNVQYPFDVSGYPEIPLIDEGADHRREVDVPADWAGDRIVLVVGAAESALEVVVDGRVVGRSTDSRLPAEFDLTDAVTPGGTTVIGLRVHRWSASTWLEDQDQWWLAGLHRSVRLERRPAVGLADVATATTELSGLDELGRWASGATLVVAVDTHGDLPPDARVRAVLRHDDAVVEAAGPADELLRLVLADVTLWTAEQPTLADLTVTLEAADDVLDRTDLRIGVRTVRVGGGRLLVNERPVTIRGVNRHEHSPDRGRYQSDELLDQDFEVLRAANVNAIRTSHSPNDERFYERCDELGFYVFDEANVETHGVVGDRERQPTDDPRFTDACVARARRMVQRDRNHACVVVWSLGNEADFGRNHHDMAAAVRAADPQHRPVHYHPAVLDPLVDVIAPMYPTLTELERLALDADDRPIVMCEYSHAMGNSNGGIEAYWELIRRHPRLGGGFVWDWVDQGIERFTEDGRRWWAYGGDFGDEPNDGPFNCNGLVAPDRTPHPVIDHLRWVYRPVAVTDGGVDHATGERRLDVTNRFDHRRLDGLHLHWRLEADGNPVAEGGPLPLPEVGPGRTGSLELRLPRTPLGAEAWLHLEIHDPDRGSIAVDQFRVANGAHRVRPPTSLEPLDHGVCAADDEGATLEVGAARLRVGADGSLEQLGWGDDDVPVRHGRIGWWRAVTDNDNATFGPERVAHEARRLGIPGAEATPIGDWRCEAGEGWASAERTMRIVDGFDLDARWWLDASGAVGLDLRARVRAGLPPVLRLGLELELPARFGHHEWFGPGPTETYPDRVEGLPVGRHRAAEPPTCPYVRPQEYGNHTRVRWLTAGRGAEALVVSGDDLVDVAVLPAWGHELEGPAHPHEVETDPDTVILRVDGAHRGLGTASCGPGVDRHWEVPLDQWVTRILLRQQGSAADPADVAHRSVRWPARARWPH